MKRKITIIIVLIASISGCFTQRKVEDLNRHQVQAEVSVGAKEDPTELNYTDTITTKELVVTDLQGREQLIMKAVKDEESGEMIASEELREVVVVARFRNLAERNGMVDIAFDIKVPKEMHDPDWQVRFAPYFYILGDTTKLDELHITGDKYREEQLKGYQLYDKFLKRILPEGTDFTYRNLLDIFIERNLQELHRLKSDSSLVKDIDSLFFKKEQIAIEHYTKGWLVASNNRKRNRKGKMYQKYVKVPLIQEGIRLDSVITNSEGDVTYHYLQPVKTRKGLRKVEMALSGSIFNEGESIYTMPQSAPLTFYISSMVTFADNSPHYIKRVVERNAEENTAAYIDFKAGRYNLDDKLYNNHEEISRIKGNIKELLLNRDFIIDSLVVVASCSPEGSLATNRVLAQNRATAIKSYFLNYTTQYIDSLSQKEEREREQIWELDMTGGAAVEKESPKEVKKSAPFSIESRSIPEEWNRFKQLIQSDTNIKNREAIEKCFKIKNLDKREMAIAKTEEYIYLRKNIYPKLRTVLFNFHLHRKGMVKDTIHTTELDTIYMSGLKALEDRDYKVAIERLRAYNDFNSAVAFISLDYNQSALIILEKLPQTAKRDYMLAIVYSRLKREKEAVESFIHSVEQEPSMIHRGNLDPEIAILIKRYKIADNPEY